MCRAGFASEGSGSGVLVCVSGADVSMAAQLHESGPPGFRCLMVKNPFEFIQEVRAETAKVTWPSWKEVWITTVMVMIMVALASIFFLLADQLMGWVVSLILQIGR
jgi:preprotein translocase subunit SecE